MRAALHVHSTWSDGEFTLAELRQIFLAAGCQVIAVTDHAQFFDDASAARYAEECAALSDDRLLMIPGLEFGCRQRMHIVGYGVTRTCASEDPAVVIRHIAGHGGVSMIAHPKDEFFDWIRSFATLPDGIEAWNSKYDGKRAPRPETFELIRGLRERQPALQAFYGIDLHWKQQFRGLFVHLQLDDSAPSRDTVLTALRDGRFEGVAGPLRLPSSAALTPDLARRFARDHRRSKQWKGALVKVKRAAESVGLRAPAALKARLRRLF